MHERLKTVVDGHDAELEKKDLVTNELREECVRLRARLDEIELAKQDASPANSERVSEIENRLQVAAERLYIDALVAEAEGGEMKTGEAPVQGAWAGEAFAGIPGEGEKAAPARPSGVGEMLVGVGGEQGAGELGAEATEDGAKDAPKFGKSLVRAMTGGARDSFAFGDAALIAELDADNERRGELQPPSSEEEDVAEVFNTEASHAEQMDQILEHAPDNPKLFHEEYGFNPVELAKHFQETNREITNLRKETDELQHVIENHKNARRIGERQIAGYKRKAMLRKLLYGWQRVIEKMEVVKLMIHSMALVPVGGSAADDREMIDAQLAMENITLELDDGAEHREVGDCRALHDGHEAETEFEWGVLETMRFRVGGHSGSDSLNLNDMFGRDLDHGEAGLSTVDHLVVPLREIAGGLSGGAASRGGAGGSTSAAAGGGSGGAGQQTSYRIKNLVISLQRITIHVAAHGAKEEVAVQKSRVKSDYEARMAKLEDQLTQAQRAEKLENAKVKKALKKVVEMEQKVLHQGSMAEQAAAMKDLENDLQEMADKHSKQVENLKDEHESLLAKQEAAHAQKLADVRSASAGAGSAGAAPSSGDGAADAEARLMKATERAEKYKAEWKKLKDNVASLEQNLKQAEEKLQNSEEQWQQEKAKILEEQAKAAGNEAMLAELETLQKSFQTEKQELLEKTEKTETALARCREIVADMDGHVTLHNCASMRGLQILDDGGRVGTVVTADAVKGKIGVRFEDGVEPLGSPPDHSAAATLDICDERGNFNFQLVRDLRVSALTARVGDLVVEGAEAKFHLASSAVVDESLSPAGAARGQIVSIDSRTECRVRWDESGETKSHAMYDFYAHEVDPEHELLLDEQNLGKGGAAGGPGPPEVAELEKKLADALRVAAEEKAELQRLHAETTGKMETEKKQHVEELQKQVSGREERRSRGKIRDGDDDDERYIVEERPRQVEVLLLCLIFG